MYVINTCTVTNMGDKKSRQIISRARRTNPDAIIAAVGCYSQMAPKEVSEIPGVDVVLGTRNKGDVVYYVNKAKDEGQPQVHVQPVLQNKKFEDLKIEDYQDKTRAFLKIQDGCNRFCTYCTIPYARGSVCSKDPDKVLSEVRELAAHGFKEIILSGIHTASYGLDLEGNINLINIIEEIEKIDGIERIRIGSIEPAFFTDEVVEKIKGFKKLCPHFHLSLQSGCDATLKRMNRRYTAEEYEASVNMLRKTLPDVSISTDVIVGFPGETEEEFNELATFLKDYKLENVGVFAYSQEEDTPAAIMDGQIEENIKKERQNTLMAIQRDVVKEQIKLKIGNIYDTIIDSNNGEYFIGRNYEMAPEIDGLIYIKKHDGLSIGDIIKVKVTDVMEYDLIGEIFDELSK